MSTRIRWLFFFGATAASLALSSRSLALSPIGVQFLGELQPTGLPAGIPFGGGGNSSERRVDISGSLAVVSAGVFSQGASEGRAFVFDFSDPNSIHQIAALPDPGIARGGEYGHGVAISGNYVFVTAHGESSDTGAVYMYDVSDPANIVERRITAFDGAPQNYFGRSIAVDGNRLLVGAPKYTGTSQPKAAYVIDFSDPDHLQQRKLVLGTGGLGGSQPVAISGNYAIVGDDVDSADFPFAGSARLYDITDLNSIREVRLTPTDGPNYNAFGRRVAISGTTALVSVSSDPGPTNNAGTFDGAVWAFDFHDWNHITQTEFGWPVSGFGGPPPPFGRFLDLGQGLAAIGAFNEDNTRGAVYLYDVSNAAAPIQLLRLPAYSANDSRFGISFALDGRNLLVSDQAGHAYIYHLTPEPHSVALGVLAATVLLAFHRGRA